MYALQILSSCVFQSVQGVVEDDDGGPCGWWTLRPTFLQKFRTPKWALFWLCWAGALQGKLRNYKTCVNRVPEA